MTLNTQDTGDSLPEDNATHAEKAHYVPIVAIGASAGGLDAFKALISNLPNNSGFGFVVIQHMDPNHESKLSEILSKQTAMPVLEAADGLKVERDHIYVIPSAVNLKIGKGVLRLEDRKETRGMHLPIDCFLKSLAEEQGSKSIAAILSGTGSDGTLGASEIKAAGGITFAQEPESAKFRDMPMNVIRDGSADFVLTPENIASEIKKIGSHPYLTSSPDEEFKGISYTPGSDSPYTQILRVIRTCCDVDFSQYRDTTIKRRIMRRMALHKINSLPEYAEFLKKNSPETHALFEDILINVTSFFRNPESFESLKINIFPEIVQNKSREVPIRLWTAGCSTGQEAYSLAMITVEFLEQKAIHVPIQIFASDISDVGSLERARLGVYPESIEAEISPDRLRRFFVKEQGHYRVIKPLRNMCVFAKHNFTSDPPFSRIDLISCRNVLIYLSPSLQKQVVPFFHYALNPNGYLWLGNSETVASSSDLFTLVDKKSKIYLKKQSISKQPHFPLNYKAPSISITKMSKEINPGAVDFKKEADRIMLSQYAPSGVLVNENLEVLQFRGHTGPYLEPASGDASLNLMKMCREGLFPDLSTAVQEVKRTNSPVVKRNVRIRSANQYVEIDIKVIPVRLPISPEGCLLILFEEHRGENHHASVMKEVPEVAPKERDREIAEIRKELTLSKEYLQSMIEQYEAATEELKSANEEILSSNEELQSTNEEMETSKEELQSANEELTTVNEELQNRNTELNQLNNDLTNLLSSVTIPILMLGNDLRIRRFTPAGAKILNLIKTDVGRPITDIKSNIEVPDFERLVLEVIETVSMKEREVKDRDGHWYLLRISPYRTMDHRIEGAVVVFVDIHQVKCYQEEIEHSKKLLAEHASQLEQRVAERTAELNKVNKELERSNKSLETFAYVASHDLKEPVRTVISYLQLLEEEYVSHSPDPKIRMVVDAAIDGGKRIHELINDLLEYSQIRRHRNYIKDTDCEMILESCLSNLKDQLEKVGAVVTHDPLPHVMADSSQMLQLFQNLISNAIKFKRDPIPRIHISAKKGEESGLWTFSVQHNGIGIDPEFFERIFILFQRLHTKDEYPGTGIGLAICMEIVHRHGGKIWVESTLGKGSTFHFTIKEPSKV